VNISAGDLVASLRQERHSGLETQLFIAHRALTRAGEVTAEFDDWLDGMSPAEMRQVSIDVDAELTDEVEEADPTLPSSL